MAPATLLSVVVVLAVLDFAATAVYQTDDAVIIELDGEYILEIHPSSLLNCKC